MADSKGSLKSFFRKILRLRPRDQIEKAWTEDDPTFGYRPSRLLPSELVIDELPLFTLRTARMMLSDPVVRIGLTCRNAALAPAQIEVTCKDARVREWIGNQWQYLWNKHRTSLLRAKIFGHVGLQLEFEKNKKTGTIDIAGVKEFAPEDIRPLSHGGKVAALRVKSRLSVPVLLPPRGVYLSFDDDAGNPGGASILKRAYSPWWEKHMPTGALATRRLRLIKDAYIGDVFQFPFAETVQDELGNPIPWRDIIRSVSEARLAGATIVIPRKVDAEGNEQITYTPPQDTGSPTGIYEWVDKLDRDIWRGLDVFEEVIQAAETGSGFSGRSIPLVMFLEGCEEELVQIIKGLDQFVFGPLTYWNFGPNVEYDIKVVPLVKTFATEMGGSPMGGESMGGQASSRPPGGQQPPPQQGQPAKPQPGPPGGAPQRKPTQFREPAETDGLPTIDYAQSDAIASRTVSALRDVMRLRPSEIQREVARQRRGQQRLRRGENTLSAMLSVIPILITKKQQRAQEIAEDGLFASAVVGAAAAQATIEREAEATQAAIAASPTAPTEPVAPAVVPVDEIPVPEFRTVPTSLEDLDRVSIAPTPETETETPKPPRGRVPSTESTFGRRKRVRFPNEIRARKKLRDSVALAGQNYRETAQKVREDAFAITTKMGDDIVAHIRDALKKNMREGMDLKSFIAEVEKIQRGQEYPLSRARIELVFRANTARYLSDAADAALNNPMVADQFPYRAYAATHDDRVRDTHLRLEQTGLNGTNVYRGDDPAWKAFRPPWAYNCRCAWRPVGVRQAARIGVVEANNWLARATARANAEGGIADQYLVRVKPASGDHVAWPSIDGETFYPSPEWTRNGVQFGEPWGRIAVDKPTEAQKEAGNYRKGHVTWNGLRIAIENPRGSIRSGDGWRVVMKSHYGYIKSTEGRDGDHVDVFLGPNPDSEIIFVVNQVDRNGKFDEHKCLIGWDNEDDAKAGYLSNYSKGWKCGPIVSMTLPQFKDWLENGNTRKPCCEQFAEIQRGLFGDEFDVESKPAKPQKKAKPESTDRQGMLWTGLDLLPGQRDFIDEGGDEVTESTKGTKPSKSDDDFESKHPRKPAGDKHGGEFIKKADATKKPTSDFPGSEKDWPSARQLNLWSAKHLDAAPKPIASLIRRLHSKEAESKDMVSIRVSHPGARQELRRAWDFLKNSSGEAWYRKLKEGYGASGPWGSITLNAPAYNSKPWVVTYTSSTAEVWQGRDSDDYERHTQFREAAQSGWITLGGGASVFVDDGHIELGCPGLKGEEISDLVDESDESRAKRRKRQETAEALGLEGEDVDVEDLDELEAGEAPDDADADFDFGANVGTDDDTETDPVEDFERQATEFALGLGFGPEVLGIDRASINVAIADGTPPEVYAQSRIDDWMAQFQPGAKVDLKNRQFRRGTKLYKQIAESVRDEHGNVNDDDVQYFGSVLLDVLDMRQREAIDWNQTRRDMLWEMGLSDGMAAARIAKEINAGKDATQIKRFDEVLKVLRGERGDRYRALLRVTQSESEGKDDDESALKDLLATRQRKVPSLEDTEVWQEAWSAAQYGMQRAKTFDPDEEYWKSVEFSEPKHWALNYWDYKDEYFQFAERQGFLFDTKERPLWDEDEHPRAAEGSADPIYKGGRFVPKGKKNAKPAPYAQKQMFGPDGLPVDDQSQPEEEKNEAQQSEQKTEDKPDKDKTPEFELSDKTPREQAEEAQEDSDDYEFARRSAIGNRGEDLKGSARHIRNLWKGLAAAEADGTAEKLVNRKTLVESLNNNLVSDAEENPLSALAAYLTINAFPANVDYGKQASPERQKQLRSQYVSAFERISSRAMELAATENDAGVVQAELKALTNDIVKEIRNDNADKYNPVANSLIELYYSIAGFKIKGYGRAKRGVGADLEKFASNIKKELGDVPIGGTLEAKREYMEKVSDRAQAVIEGQTIDKVFGVESQRKKGTTLSLSDRYVNFAKRTGGPELDFTSGNKAADFMVDALKMRGVQWGNSVSDDERQHHGIKAAEALVDIADILNLPPEAASIGGTLGLAIGARGHKGASAHYEPDGKVINLTRKNGVGTLAHEWGHAMDHHIGGGGYIGHGSKKEAGYGSNVTGSNVQMHQGVKSGKIKFKTDKQRDEFLKSWPEPTEQEIKHYEAYSALKKSWDDSGFRKRCIDGLKSHVQAGTISRAKANDYWLSDVEMFARTFEVFVGRKLQQANRENTYLAGTSLMAAYDGLWPNTEEVDAMAPHFEKVIDIFRDMMTKK